MGPLPGVGSNAGGGGAAPDVGAGQVRPDRGPNFVSNAILYKHSLTDVRKVSRFIWVQQQRACG